MDTEQQIRLNFLEEAEEYLDLMESNLLGIAETAIENHKVDLILRSAHSVKGGAGMMGFKILSHVAHRIEDFLKILRVRHGGQIIEAEIETFLLQSVDVLRNIVQLHRQQQEVVEIEISSQLQPILDKLQEQLGELESADETALLAQNEDFDPAILVFEEGVDGVLDRFEAQLTELDLLELSQVLAATAEELIGFGNMVNLDSFVELCQSIQYQVSAISSAEITALAEQSLKTWRRSHALVLRGSTDKLPNQLENFEPINLTQNQTISSAESDLEGLELANLQSAFDSEPELESEPEDFNSIDLEGLELANLQSAFDSEPELESEPEDFNSIDLEGLELANLQSAFELEEPTNDMATTIQLVQDLGSSSPSIETKPVEQVDKLVRVPASQLQQFNNLFEQLVINRNSINVRLEQLQRTVSLLGQRMIQIEKSNIQLKQWYDRASIEGVLAKQKSLVAISSASLETLKQVSVPSLLSGNSNTSQKVPKNNASQEGFDSLEMDTYSDIHLICQEQIETILQLQEVATDIKLGIQEVHQSTRELHFTTKSMQGNVARTQMLPFADAVKRCPRIIRDLNSKGEKKVNLQILGDSTLLDRGVIELLGDPIMHLLRNSFDHGIEDPVSRVASGKSEAGSITLQAQNQGTFTIIKISDDGGGINLDKIGDRIVQMGLTRAEVAQLTEAELLQFIFEPGFSTASQVTEVSGRGIGMDVVRTNLEEINGQIEVDTSAGQGTTFTLKIPFSLSILRVAVVQQDKTVFAIPANSIRELISQSAEHLRSDSDPSKILWNQQQFRLIDLSKMLIYSQFFNAVELMGIPNISQPTTLIIENEYTSGAIKLDRFWSEQETTIKPIECPIPLPPGIISSVILGDGRVLPLLDPLALLEQKAIEYINEKQVEFNDLDHIQAPSTNKILIVDDSVNIRNYLSLTLENAGYDVEQARDGQEAVDKLLGGLVVQAVICDLEMPRLDGYGVLEEIKERLEFADLPIMMLTSRSSEKHRKMAMNLGATAYFSKPYNEVELLKTLESKIVN